MNNQEAIGFISNTIQEYVSSIQQINPAAGFALAFTANAAIQQVTGVINQYQAILDAQNGVVSASESVEVSKEVATPQSHYNGVPLAELFEQAQEHKQVRKPRKNKETK